MFFVRRCKRQRDFYRLDGFCKQPDQTIIIRYQETFRISLAEFVYPTLTFRQRSLVLIARFFASHHQETAELRSKCRIPRFDPKEYIDRGDLVPDSVTIDMLEDRLSQPDCDTGFLLDGFPRTIVQAEELEKLLAQKNVAVDAVISIIISDEEIKSRISGRRVCISCGASYNIPFKPAKVEGICDECGGEVIQRQDDKPETVLSRLQTYHEKTQPLIDFYKAKGLILEASNEENYKLAVEQVINGLSGRKIV